MTMEKVKKALLEIERIKDDDESAHVKEDELWMKVLAEIARSDSVYGPLAREALKTKDIEFSRWCA